MRIIFRALLLALAFLAPSIVCAAEARFAFQDGNAPTGNWNSGLSAITFGPTSLIDIDTGSSTGWTLTGTEVSSVGEHNGGTNSVGSGDAAWVDQAVIGQDVWYSITTARGFDFVFGGLDNGKTYTIEFYGSISAVTGAVSGFTLGGSTITLDAGGNTTNVARFSSVSPTSGQISISWRRHSSATADAPINAVRIIEDEDPGSSANLPAIYRHLRQQKQ